MREIWNLIYQGECSCKETYIGETIRNAQTRFNEHEDIRKTSEPAKHLKNNTTHTFTWSVISRAPENFQKRKILEAYYIQVLNPSLNEQLDSDVLTLFRNGIT